MADGAVFKPELVATLVLADTYAGWKGSLPGDELRARVAGPPSVELKDDGAAPRQPAHVCRHTERLQECRQRGRVSRQPEGRRHVRGSAGSRLVPSDDREIIGESGDLRAPLPRISGCAVDEHQGRSVARLVVGDVQFACLNPMRAHFAEDCLIAQGALRSAAGDCLSTPSAQEVGALCAGPVGA